MVDPTAPIQEYAHKGPWALAGVVAGFVVGFLLFYGWQAVAAADKCANGWHQEQGSLGEYEGWAVICDGTDEVAATFDPKLPLVVLGFAGFIGGALGYGYTQNRELERHMAAEAEAKRQSAEPKRRRRSPKP